jgi:glycosyltransferase involved in cell wall biosynthesis
MRARVAIDVTPILYTANGIGRCTRSLVDALLVRDDPDIDLTLFGRRLGGSRLRSAGVDARRMVHLRLPRLAERMIRSLGLFELCCRADLYHATDFYSPLRSGRRAIATIHDVIFLKAPEPMVDHARLARWVGGFARDCSAIITCSRWCKREIVETLNVDPAKVHVIYWGVDHGVFYPEPDRQSLRDRLRVNLGIVRPYFLAVSCSTGRKNTPRLLQVYSRLLTQQPSNDLVAVWNPPADIVAQYASEIAAGRLHFTGRVSDAVLRDLYAGATAVIYPSLSEGFGLPMLEAMSCGAPVIASNATCLPEIAENAAVYVDPRDDEDIASALLRFEQNPQQFESLRRTGPARAAQFTWGRCADQTLDVYRNALARS